MKGKVVMMASLVALVSLTLGSAAEDLSSFGDPVEKIGPARPAAQSNEPAIKLWPLTSALKFSEWRRLSFQAHARLIGV
jgi:hypothetical protein